MGMAASQARFLGLTARKTNVEYEGQQVNQQRTALSNQSASYYTNLLGMNVPQPPSVQDYSKTIYTFTDGALSNQLTSMIAHADGSYTISYLRNYLDSDAIIAAVPSRITKAEVTGEAEEGEEPASETFYFVGGQLLRKMGEGSDADPYYKSLATEDGKKQAALLEDERHYMEKLNKDYSQTGEDEWFVKYTLNQATGAYVPTFYNKSVLDGATYDETSTSVSYIGAYTKGTAQVNEEIKGVKALLEQDATGRYINIMMEDLSGNMVTYALSTSTVTDDKAYRDAMNQYEYDKAQYDKDIREINAKIEVIQCEDKDLEIRLKQLDTEQDAITNEMDAVTKVIEKNVESSFKTFG